MSRAGRLAIALLGAGCVGAACHDTQAPPIRVAVGLRVPDSVVLVEGDSLRLRAALVDSAGDTLPAWPVAWVSQDTLIARVSPGGLLRPADPGEATVVALAAGLSASVRIVSAVRHSQLSLGSPVSSFMTWCGLTARGSLVCRDPYDLRPRHLTPLRPPAGAVLRSVSVGGNHVCAVATDGRAFCWGNNRYGQLGADTAVGTYDEILAPIAVAGNLAFDSLSAGATHTCGVTTSGAAYCWGSRAWGKLGDGDTTRLFSSYATAPAAVAGAHVFRAVSAGTEHTCGLATDGTLYCWGANDLAQLGSGSLSNSVAVRPLLVSGGLRYASVAAGYHTCALASDGGVYCWGANPYGALGHATDTTCAYAYPCSLTPQRVSLAAAVQVGTGMRLANTSRTCALTSGGAAYCWGRGPLGDGLGDTVQTAPVAVAGGHVFSSIVVGEGDACGTTPDGVVWCWGSSFGLVPARLPFQP